MRRREFIAGFGGAAAWPVVGRAQQPVTPVVGFLNSGALETSLERFAAFHRGLGEVGYFEGRNVAIEYRWAQDQFDRLPMLAADLVRRHVAVIVATGGTPAVLAAKAATRSIPIIFIVGTDPVETGLVASFARPDGNATGVTSLTTDVVAKRLALLHELVPAATSIAFLVNPTNPIPTSADINEFEGAARALGVNFLILKARTPGEIEGAFTTLVEQRARALFVNSDTFYLSQRDQIIALAARHAVPAIYVSSEFATWGGLISYGTNFSELYRQVGIYAGRILRGEKPADLPVQRAVKIELVVNMKTAKALGLTVPETLLATADEVIQ
jgi:putative tryptophan/tyrosine transport system substrate-binding protein